jgi:hypothetical protein
MEVLVIVGALVAIALVAYFIKKKNKNPDWYLNPVDRGFKYMREVTPVMTPGENIAVYYEPKVNPIPLEAADQGIRNLFTRLRCKYPLTDRGRHDIKLVVLASEKAPESGTPAFRVAIANGTPYYNSEWDMMRGSKESVHYVLAAGQMMAAGVPYGDVLLIPSDSDVTFITNIVDYEEEHAALANYDPAEFERTKIHGAGTGHPIVPSCPGVVESLFTRVENVLGKHADMEDTENDFSGNLILVK